MHDEGKGPLKRLTPPWGIWSAALYGRLQRLIADGLIEESDGTTYAGGITD
jgi:hypothetical protein